jgi:CheY-specific phosphatase CheX
MSGNISSRACTGFDHFIMAAAKSAFALPGAQCAVTQVSGSPTSQHDVVMLSVASYRFRLLLFIHFDRNLATRRHLAALISMQSEQMVGERFVDAMMERGNLCCGALNRELAQFFPHIGMSTPCVLSGSSLEHISTLHPSLTRHYRADVATGVALHITLAVCAFADIDFPFDVRVAKAPACGALEMFT